MNRQKMNSKTTALNPDVLVIGAGSAGVAAAIGAVDAGASVVIIEKNTFSGGNATAAYVSTVCGLYYRSQEDYPKPVHHGFPLMFAERLAKASQSSPVKHKHGLWFLPYEIYPFIFLCDQLLLDNKIDFFYNSMVIDTHFESSSIKAVDALVSNQRFRFFPKTVVDASGVNLISGMTNVDPIEDLQYQASAQVFRLSGLTETQEDILTLAMVRAIMSNEVSKNKFFNSHIVPGTLKEGSATIKIPLVLPESLESPDRTQGIVYGRAKVQELVEHLKSHSDIFKNCKLEYLANENGIRTGKRNKGLYELTSHDVLSCNNFEDSIVKGAWPIEIWEPYKKMNLTFFPEDQAYGIPNRCLKSSSSPNLFYAGKNISADMQAIASCRVIGTCLATGYTSGVLAAYQSQSLPESTANAFLESRLNIP
jgi:hypothetical protein